MFERDIIYTNSLELSRIKKQMARMTCTLEHHRLSITRRWNNVTPIIHIPQG